MSLVYLCLDLFKDCMGFEDRRVFVHYQTDNPTAAWADLSHSKICRNVPIATPTGPLSALWTGHRKPNTLRCVCISDTHGKIEQSTMQIPPGDILIHAGDFTSRGERLEVIKFNTWLGTLPHRYKLVISGNHEYSFDEQFKDMYNTEIPYKHYLSNCLYLQDEGVVIEGLKFYGTPWVPAHRNSAFNLRRGQQCLDKWEMIPKDTDVLISHTPPLGYGDLLFDNQRGGCVELMGIVQKQIKPKVHIFGHIHEGYGMYSDGTTLFVNASTCDRSYQPIQVPIVFDICT